MSAQPEEASTPRGPWKLWFYLTKEERRLVLGILVLALIGLAARYMHLRNQRPDPLPAAPAAEIR